MSDNAAIEALSAEIGAAMGDLANTVANMSSDLADVENRVIALRQECQQMMLRTKIFVQTRESQMDIQLNQLSNSVERIAAEVISETTAGVNDTLARVSSSNENLVASVQNVQQVSQTHLQMLQQQLSGLQQVRDQFEEAMSTSEQYRNEIDQNLETFEQDANARAEEIRNIGLSAAEELKTEIEALRTAARQYVNDEMITQTSQRFDIVTADLQQILASDFVTALETGGSEFEGHVTQTVMTQFDSMLQELSALVDELIELMHSATTNSETEREALDALIKQIEDITGPITGSLDTVRDIASAVGFNI